MYNKIFSQNIEVMIEKAVFPAGIKAAHEKLHGLLNEEKTRRYFGISWMGKNNEIVYYAAAEILEAGEPGRYGLETFTIKKGNYCGKLLKDWCNTPNLVGDTFRELLQDPKLDPHGYCLEIYLNDTDMECLVKLKD